MKCNHNTLKTLCKKCKLLGVGGNGLCDEHYKRRSTCKDCKKLGKGGGSICNHNIERSKCKDCKKDGKGGGSICDHEIERSFCKECKKLGKGGNLLCDHYNKRDFCKECKNLGTGGKLLCDPHHKRKSSCKECKGSRMCKEHNKRKDLCVECKKAGKVVKGICEHYKRKNRCKKCKGSQICKEHNTQKDMCKKCKENGTGGSGLCDHYIRKDRCVPCGGNQRCDHKKMRNRCKVCKQENKGGSRICDHKIDKAICRECKGPGCGVSFCIHDKFEQSCVKCHPERACQNCKHIYIKSKSKFKPYCFDCFCVLNPDADIPRKYKIREQHVRDALKEFFPNIQMEFDKIVDEGCSRRRPDVRIECLTHSIIIECDENEHKRTSCENKRTMELFQDLGNRPLVVLRFNPDKYTLSYNGEQKEFSGCFKDTKSGLSIVKTEWDKRIYKLRKYIEYYMKRIPKREVTIKYLFYSEELTDNKEEIKEE